MKWRCFLVDRNVVIIKIKMRSLHVLYRIILTSTNERDFKNIMQMSHFIIIDIYFDFRRIK